MYLRQLEYERRMEKDYGRRAKSACHTTLGEHSHRIKRSNSVEGRMLRSKIHVIQEEETQARHILQKQHEAMTRLQCSIKAPVSTPLSQSEMREFHRRMGYRPIGGRVSNTASRAGREWLKYYDAQGNEVLRKNTTSSRLQTPEELRESWRRLDQRHPRSVKVLKNTMHLSRPEAKTYATRPTTAGTSGVCQRSSLK